MTFDLDDTIAAIATAPGGGLRGIVRLSGLKSVEIATSLAGGNESNGNAAGRVPTCCRGSMTLPRALGDVPVTLYLWPTNSSYTRQPSAELHLPGSPPLVEAALEAACQAGARLARPGEFTLRAFLAGRLDLTQAEAVLGVIDAGGHKQLVSALAQLAGGLAKPLNALREQLLDLLAQLEAGLDFVDEDIEFISSADLQCQLSAAAQAVENIARQMQSRGETGLVPRVVLVGLPNVGKSSLLNALAGESAAIVSEAAGTTRDFVARRVSMGRCDCLLIDTAGRSDATSANHIELAAQSLATRQAMEADVILLCLDAFRPLDGWEQDQLRTMNEAKTLAVWTKCDLSRAATSDTSLAAVCTSSYTRAGLDDLRQAIQRKLEASPAEHGVVAGTADRCRESLNLAGEALHRAQATISASEELVAAEIRIALDELGKVVGAVYTEDILDRVFSRFCIGK